MEVKHPKDLLIESLDSTPRARLELATLRLTAGCSTIELPRNSFFQQFPSLSRLQEPLLLPGIFLIAKKLSVDNFERLIFFGPFITTSVVLCKPLLGCLGSEPYISFSISQTFKHINRKHITSLFNSPRQRRVRLGRRMLYH